jgi:hypothetical protein
MGVGLLLGLIGWVGYLGRPHPSTDGRTTLFRHNAFFRGFAYLSAFGVMTGLTALTYLYPPKRNEIWYIIGLYFFFAGLTLPLVWEASRFYVLLTPHGLEARSAWRGNQSILWNDVSELSFSTLNAWFVFRSTNGDTIRTHVFVAGLKNLIRTAESQIPPTAMKKARAGYERLGMALPDSNDEPILEARAPRRPGEW